MGQKSALFFCSSNSDINPQYIEAARKVVRATCLKGYTIVSGGATRGLMKVVADEAVACGAENIGVLPRFMEEFSHPDLTQMIWTDTMSQRKDAMRLHGRDIAVALPGGIGTLDEFFETYTLAKLGKYNGKIVLFNCCGFYDGIRDQLDFLVREGMLEQKTRDIVHFPRTVEEFEKLL
ncbi:MAG: TIGR00730 family Rossman fold protein [Bacteroidales bacterium]|nr:TIGR00730 family Rossman fold protein [Bacteroidales bacterium]